MKTFEFFAVNKNGSRCLVSVKAFNQKQAINQAKSKAKQFNLVLIF